MTTSSPHRVVAALVMAVVLAGGAVACGGSGGDDPEPDEATFCLLAQRHEPVAEADAEVLRRLDELAPDEVDAGIVVLREAAEELENLTPGSPDAIAAEFEIRFDPAHIAARRQVEDFLRRECGDGVRRTVTTQDAKEP